VVEPTPSEKSLPLHKVQCVFVSWENGRHLHILETVYLIPPNLCARYWKLCGQNMSSFQPVCVPFVRHLIPHYFSLVRFMLGACKLVEKPFYQN